MNLPNLTNDEVTNINDALRSLSSDFNGYFEASSVFGNSVTQAIRYFNSGGMPRNIRIYSNSHQSYYRNSLTAPTIFNREGPIQPEQPKQPKQPTIIDEKEIINCKLNLLTPDSDGYVDASEIFQNSVSRAIRYFNSGGKPKKLRIYSNSHQSYYRNSLETLTEFTIEQQTVESNFKEKYLKYKEKYLNLKKSLE